MFFDPVRDLQVRRDEHETEIRFRRHLAEGEQLSGFQRAGFLHQRGERDFRGPLLGGVEQLPLAIFDPVKEMEAMPAILRDEWRGRRIHERNFPVRGERVKRDPGRFSSVER